MAPCVGIKSLLQLNLVEEIDISKSMLLSFVNGSSSVIWLVLECATCVLNQNSNQKFITADLSKDSEQQAEDL